MLSGASVSSQCIVAATSSALLILFRGIIPTAASLDASDEVMGEESLVSVSPGATALTLIRLLLYVAAADLTIDSTPPLAADIAS